MCGSRRSSSVPAMVICLAVFERRLTEHDAGVIGGFQPFRLRDLHAALDRQHGRVDVVHAVAEHGREQPLRMATVTGLISVFTSSPRYSTATRRTGLRASTWISVPMRSASCKYGRVSLEIHPRHERHVDDVAVIFAAQRVEHLRHDQQRQILRRLDGVIADVRRVNRPDPCRSAGCCRAVPRRKRRPPRPPDARP